MLNPDGVFRGYYRTDTNGINLNRVYNDPIRNLHPTIFGVVEYTKYLSLENKVFCYIDLHGHATKRGCFVYGNYFNSFSKQIESCIFPKLMSLNCVNFTFDGSSFTERNGSAGDRREGVSKEGCGRV